MHGQQNIKIPPQIVVIKYYDAVWVWLLYKQWKNGSEALLLGFSNYHPASLQVQWWGAHGLAQWKLYVTENTKFLHSDSPHTILSYRHISVP